MADSDDEDLRSSHTSVDLPASTDGGSSTQIHPDPIPDQEVSVSGPPSEVGPPVFSEETLQEQVNIRLADTGDQVSGGQAHETGSSSRDKGKAPARAYDDFSSSSQVNNAEISHASLSPQSLTATSGITEDLKELKLPSTSATDIADRRAPDESNQPGVGLGDEGHSTQKPALTSKQKQKQKAEPEKSAEPEPAPPAPTLSGPGPGDGVKILVFRPLQPGDPGWEKSSDRPPKKLPIRFKDAVGRQYVFPWEKAKTWEVSTTSTVFFLTRRFQGNGIGSQAWKKSELV